jgi:glycosyltransferase involved in cell wall biosynthesis
MKKIRILVTASTYPRHKNDTTPNFVHELSRRLTKDFDIYVLCPYDKNSKKYEEFDNVKVYRYKYLPFGLGTLAYGGGIVSKLKENKFYYLQVAFFLLFQLIALKKIVKKEQINLIHAHWIIPQGLIAVLYKKIFNKQIDILVTIHGSDIFSFSNNIGKWIKLFVLNNIDELTVVSTAIKGEVKKLGYKKEIYVYPMGVDTKLFRPQNISKKIREELYIKDLFLLFVGRLAENKGVRYLLEAMPEVLKKYPLVKLVIIGEGALKDELIHLSESLNLSKNVIFLGSVRHEQLPSYFATADIFIGSSIVAEGVGSEGFGLVFAEAMSCGTPVIATDLPAIEDIVKDNETGFIVRQKNSKEISEKIIYLLDNRDKLNEIKMKGRGHVIQNFDWDITANKYTNLIKEKFHGISIKLDE